MDYEKNGLAQFETTSTYEQIISRLVIHTFQNSCSVALFFYYYYLCI